MRVSPRTNFRPLFIFCAPSHPKFLTTMTLASLFLVQVGAWHRELQVLFYRYRQTSFSMFNSILLSLHILFSPCQWTIACVFLTCYANAKSCSHPSFIICSENGSARVTAGQNKIRPWLSCETIFAAKREEQLGCSGNSSFHIGLPSLVKFVLPI